MKLTKRKLSTLIVLGLLGIGFANNQDTATATNEQQKIEAKSSQKKATEKAAAEKAAAEKTAAEKAAAEKAAAEKAAAEKAAAEKAATEKAAAEKAAAEKAAAEKAAAEKATAEKAAAEKVMQELAQLDYAGTQTIEVNNNVPTFSSEDLSTAKGPWESYGELDSLNRVTQANALLNQSLMPTSEREDISSVTPTGWKNKEIASGYLFNRSHLIGFALSGENANWKNLMTGTRQLNSPEMLRFEMDLKYYLEQDSNRFVRYQVTPIFRDNELLARGVHLMAQSTQDNTISFNVYIFNIQDGVILNYADGSSDISAVAVPEETPPPAPEKSEPAPETNTNHSATIYVTPTGSKYHSRACGRGTYTPATLEQALARGLEPCKKCF